MEKKDNKNQEKNLSQLMEFDFDEILIDDIPTERKAEKRNEESHIEEPFKNPIRAEEEKLKQVRREKRRRRRRGFKIGFDIVTWIKDLVIAAVVFWFLTTFVASSITMSDASMDPTLVKDERYVISKIVYQFTEPDRGDVVAFEYADEQGETKEAISRVIGLPGDTIEIDANNNITVNEIPLRTDYCNGKAKFVAGELTYPYTLPDGFYFLLSDSPTSTTDSRYLHIGAVSEEEIFGRVICCYWPKEAWRPIG